MDGQDEEAAMKWCRRTGQWGNGTEQHFRTFFRMLQVGGVRPPW